MFQIRNKTVDDVVDKMRYLLGTSGFTGSRDVGPVL